jgi:apolipoprotein N-acyltransferase
LRRTFGPRHNGVSRRLGLASEAALAVLLGLLHSQSFTVDGLWWLQMAAVALLAWRVARLPPSQAAVCGAAFGTAWLGAATWWMYISLHRYGELAAWLAVLAVALLCALLSLYLAAALALYAARRVGGVGGAGALRNSALFAALWLLAELARGALFTGFPWAASGYAHTSGPLAPLAPWLGVYGIGFVAAFVSALVGHALAGRRHFGVLIGALLVVGAIGFAGPPQFSHPTSTLSLSLLQTNIAQDEKFSTEHMPEALDWLSRQLLAARGDLVVAPETAIPLLPDQLAPQYWMPITKHFHDGQQAALIGLPLGNAEVGYTNSVAGLSKATSPTSPTSPTSATNATNPANATIPIGAVSATSPTSAASETSTAGADSAGSAGEGGYYRYDKHHLVPFGEFIPTGFRWFVDLMNIPLGDFNRGPLAAPSFDVKGERAAPNICYEDLFGEELATRFIDDATAPTLFVNVSNIAWFGDTVALHQHLEISRMRTLEFQRPMVRSTNTGMTVVIDHAGSVTAELAPYTQGVLETSVQGRDGLTPFARWSSRAGLWPLLIIALLIVVATGLRRGAGRR